MKKTISKLLMAMALIAFVGMASAAPPERGLRYIETQKDLDELKGSPYVAHACPKCKSITILVQTSVKPGARTEEKAVNVHQCPGCEGKLVKKDGSKETKYVHVCKKCGSEDAFCCALKPGDPIPGMEKK